MSTKINVRSPFYLSYSEPTPPSVELTCEILNLQGFEVDQFGNVTKPTITYGNVLSYTSTDGDFADGRFDTVASDTSRTVTFTISIPPEFTNAANDTIDCTATTTQPTFVCTGGVTTNGTIPSQSLDTGGDTVTIDVSSYFTAGVDPIAYYNVTNNYPDYFDYSVDGSEITIVSLNKAGTHNLYVEATDGDPLTCNATQPIQITTTATQAYTCNDSYLTGGIVNQDGSIIEPNVNGTITAIKETSGGTPITSLPPNNTGSFIEHTLFFDITVPAQYSNAGATVECSKDYTQVSSALPEFTCDVAGLTGQAITTTGIIKVGTANKGTIISFSPISFGTVFTNTSRTVTYTISAPSSGYDNSGTNITCDVTMTQPAVSLTCGIAKWWDSGVFSKFMTIEQVQAAYPNSNYAYWSDPYRSIEGALLAYGVNSSVVTGGICSREVSLNSTIMEENINTAYCNFHTPKTPRLFTSKSYDPIPALYTRVSRNREYSLPTPSINVYNWYLKKEQNGFISEIWYVDWEKGSFTRVR